MNTHKLLVLDVDGVLTDGTISIDENGIEQRNFNVRDGLGIVLWKLSGREIGVISGRKGNLVEKRLQELGITHSMLGIKEKGPALTAMAKKIGCALSEIIFMGDDLNDLPAMISSGRSFTPANGDPEIKKIATTITKCQGGHGAVREMIETLLKEYGEWDHVMKKLIEVDFYK